jgi:ribosomal protein S18 acetylase RimI-like enzyme
MIVMTNVERDKLSIRLAESDDAARIASALSAAFAEYESWYTPEAYAATVPDGEQIECRLSEGPVWVALRDEKVVGTVSVVDKGDAIYIRSMAVVPSARGQRIGESLLGQVESFAAERGYERMILSTTPFLHRAIRLYENFGFRRNDAEPKNLSGTPLFTMEKLLRASAG